MGTNYYAEVKREVCPTCHHVDTEDRLHIGKSSIGWKFIFHGYQEKGLTTAKAWKEYLSGDEITIVDEYGKEESVESLFRWIHMKQKEGKDQEDTCFMDQWIDIDGFNFCDNDFS